MSNNQRLSNEELIKLIEARLIERGYRHPNDRDDLFLHEVYEILGSVI